MLVAQCNFDRYFLCETEDYDQGLPANCFKVVPIKIDRDKEENDLPGWYIGYHPRINEDWTEWEYERDYRGQTWYNGDQPVLINEFGPLPEGLTKEPFLTEEQIAADIQSVRLEKYKEIDAIRTKMWEAGVWHKGYLFQSRQKDRDNVKDVWNLVSQVGWMFDSTYSWRSSNDIMVPFTMADLCILNLSLIVQNEIVYNISWNDKDVTLASMKKKSDIRNFVPTYLDTHQIQALINQRLEPFGPLIESMLKK